MDSGRRYISLLEKRVAVGKFGNKLPDHLTFEALKDMFTKILRECPSSYNSQSTRLIILFGEDHVAYWTSVHQHSHSERDRQCITHGILPAAGSVLCFEDMDVVARLRKEFPLYADNLSAWAAQGSAMAMDMMWTALAAEGLGASRHLFGCPLRKDRYRGILDVPEQWSPAGELVFGSIEELALPVVPLQDAERFKVMQ